MHHHPLSLSQFAQILGVPESGLRALVARYEEPEPTPRAPEPQGDTTLVGLTVAEAARRIGISRTKLYEYVSSGEMPSVKIGRLRRIPAEALTEFLQRQATPADFTTAA